MDALPWIIWLVGIAIGFTALGAASQAGRINDELSFVALILFWPATMPVAIFFACCYSMFIAGEKMYKADAGRRAKWANKENE